MLDQYGNAVPADLVVLPDHCLLRPFERESILSADWYEVDGVLLYADTAGIGGDDPEDAGLAVDADGNITRPVLKVDDRLKRGSNADGWYHA